MRIIMNMHKLQHYQNRSTGRANGLNPNGIWYIAKRYNTYPEKLPKQNNIIQYKTLATHAPLVELPILDPVQENKYIMHSEKDKGDANHEAAQTPPFGRSTAQTLTKAVTHIRLEAVNAGKLVALDDLAQVYLPLCQQYVTLFCTEEMPDKFRATCFATSLSERWHRVAIQQAAGIAQSWRTNREQAYQDYLEELAEYEQQQADDTLRKEAIEPLWNEWNVPTLRQTCIQANTNVVVLEPSHDSTFDYWLKISTLEFRKPLFVPIKLAAYHRKALEGKTINTSVTLNMRSDGWWLTLSYDEVVPIQTEPSSPVVGVDVGIAGEKGQERLLFYECSVCHYPDRANRQDQQTFCCAVCGFKTHADLNAAFNIKARWGRQRTPSLQR